MKKFLFIITFLLFFLLAVTDCYASEEDILDDLIIEEEENILEKKGFILKSVNNYYSKWSKSLAFSINGSNNTYWIAYGDLQTGDKYYIYISEFGNYSNVYIPLDSYLIKGSEGINNTYYGTNGLYITIKGWDEKDISSNNMSAIPYNEPTPEPTPDPTPDPIPEPTSEPTPEPDQSVSWNSVSENLIRIEERLVNIESQIDDFKGIYVSQNETVSNNLIKKRISNYTTSESLLLIGLMLGFFAGLVFLIHKSIFKWR